MKFGLMALVIAGHVFSQSPFSATSGCTATWHWIYMFHMPLFVFLSGYFSRKKAHRQFFSGCWRLFEPLLVFQAVSLGMRYIGGQALSLRDVLTPWWVLWYLLSLLYWRSLLQIIPDRILNNTGLIIFTSLSIGLLAGFLPLNRFLSLQRTAAFLPFFFMGYCMRGKHIILPAKYKPYSILVLAATMTVPVFFAEYIGDLHQADPYYNIYGMCRRLLIFCLSVPMSVAFMNAWPSRKWMARQGKYTLQYYIYHAYIVIFLMAAVNRFGLPASYLAAVIYTLFATACIFLALQIPVFRKLTNPSVFLEKH